MDSVIQLCIHSSLTCILDTIKWTHLKARSQYLFGHFSNTSRWCTFLAPCTCITILHSRWYLNWACSLSYLWRVGKPRENEDVRNSLAAGLLCLCIIQLWQQRHWTLCLVEQSLLQLQYNHKTLRVSWNNSKAGTGVEPSFMTCVVSLIPSINLD